MQKVKRSEIYNFAKSLVHNSSRRTMTEKEFKKPKGVSIGTHNGTFHCDEALACFMLKQLPEYKNAQIIRSRDSKILGDCDIVVDVGGVFDPKIHRYDHHQRDFTESMNSLNPLFKWTTKLSSAGLVYFHFGHRVVATILSSSVDSVETKAIYEKVYENFIQEIDAIDNGISVLDGEPRYFITTNLSSRVGHLNPRWNDEVQDTQVGFEKAMELVGTEFCDRINFYSQSWWPARKLVIDAIESRHEVDESGEIMELAAGGCPWKDHLFTLETELGINKPIKFVLFEDQNHAWRVQTVPIQSGSFESRLPLREEWRGLRDDELSKVASIEECIFVHSSGFIGGNHTKKGCLEMARKTLNIS